MYKPETKTEYKSLKTLNERLGLTLTIENVVEIIPNISEGTDGSGNPYNIDYPLENVVGYNFKYHINPPQQAKVLSSEIILAIFKDVTFRYNRQVESLIITSNSDIRPHLVSTIQKFQERNKDRPLKPHVTTLFSAILS